MHQKNLHRLRLAVQMRLTTFLPYPLIAPPLAGTKPDSYLKTLKYENPGVIVPVSKLQTPQRSRFADFILVKICCGETLFSSSQLLSAPGIFMFYPRKIKTSQRADDFPVKFIRIDNLSGLVFISRIKIDAIFRIIKITFQ